MQISLNSRYAGSFVFFHTPHRGFGGESGRVHLIAERKAEALKARQRPLRFLEIFGLAEQLVRVQHHEGVEPGDVALAAFPRLRLRAHDVERAQVEEDRPPVLEPARDAHREGQRSCEGVARFRVACGGEPRCVEQRVVQVPAVHVVVVHVLFALRAELLTREPTDDRSDVLVEERLDGFSQRSGNVVRFTAPLGVLGGVHREGELDHALGRLRRIADIRHGVGSSHAARTCTSARRSGRAACAARVKASRDIRQAAAAGRDRSAPADRDIVTRLRRSCGARRR